MTGQISTVVVEASKQSGYCLTSVRALIAISH